MIIGEYNFIVGKEKIKIGSDIQNFEYLEPIYNYSFNPKIIKRSNSPPFII